MSEPLVIDGAQGEGGGQILRTSLALSALTGRPIVVERVRKKRSKPGLLRQHLTAFRAVAEICGGRVEGAALKSERIALWPGEVKGGDYRFAIPTAGSACLVFQTVLWPLLFAPQPSRVTFEGGTHNSMAPPFDFLARVYQPLLAKMGAQVELSLSRHGFYPAGGGRFEARITPCAELSPLLLLSAGEVTARKARAIVSSLPGRIAKRELKEVRKLLDWRPDECHIETVDSPGPGNVLMLEIERPECLALVTAFGARGVSSEQVAARACREMTALLEANVPVGEHLADQLLIPMALAKAGAFRTLPLSLHSETNIEVIARLLNVRPKVVAGSDGCVRVELA